MQIKGQKIKNWMFQGTAAIVAVAIGFFFIREFSRNFDAIVLIKTENNYWLIAVAFAPVLAAMLLITQAWRFTLVSLANKPISFIHGAVALNLPALAKYIPGKVWSYAIQTYWLGKQGFSGAVTVYVNLINVLSSLMVSALFGAAYLVSRVHFLPRQSAVLLLAGLIVADIIFIWQEKRALDLAVRGARHFMKREISPISTPRTLLVTLQLCYGLIYFLFGFSAFILSKGLGFSLGDVGILSLTSILAVADSIGFLAILVPGGLGIREGVILSILSHEVSMATAVVLPIVTRILMMLTEIIVAGLCLLYLRRSKDFRVGEFEQAGMEIHTP